MVDILPLFLYFDSNITIFSSQESLRHRISTDTGNGMLPNRQQAITRNNDASVQWRIYALAVIEKAEERVFPFYSECSCCNEFIVFCSHSHSEQTRGMKCQLTVQIDICNLIMTKCFEGQQLTYFPPFSDGRGLFSTGNILLRIFLCLPFAQYRIQQSDFTKGYPGRHA